MKQNMPIVEVNGTRLNYLQIESEQGEQAEYLVMVHGLATNMAFWYMLHAQEYAKRFNVILFDLRGHGRSKMTEHGYSPENLALDLQALLNHLQLSKVHLMAHSFGGVVALNFACLQPERVASLAIADTQISLMRHSEDLCDWQYGKKLQQQLDAHGLDIDVTDPFFGYKLLAKAADLQKQDVAMTDELQELLTPIIGNFGNRAAKQWIKLLNTTSAEADMMGDDGLSLQRLRLLNFPILALYGEYSVAMFTGKALLSVWPNAWFRGIRKAGHFFPTTRADEVINLCQVFWDGLSAGAPNRDGDAQAYFQCDRFWNEAEDWFFYSREGTEGPFLSQADAQQALNQHLELVVSEGDASER